MKQVPTKISPPLSIGQRIIAFNKGLQYTGSLPEGFAVLNPYLDNPETIEVMTAFYNRFYHDEAPRGLQGYPSLTPSTWRVIVAFACTRHVLTRSPRYSSMI